MTDRSIKGPLPWQFSHWQRVLEQHRLARLPHALLLSGPTGGGKQLFAKALAEYVLCQAPRDTGCCGQCKGCQLNAAGTHPDLIELYPDEPGKPIKIDQIRSLADFLGNAAQQGGYRVVLLGPAEAMNLNAANALLKGLEEPGARTLFVLVSDASGRMLPTIRSRCQVLSFPLPARPEALSWLASQPDIQEPERLLSATGGAPLQALVYQQRDYLALRAKLLLQLADIFSGQETPIGVANEWQKLDLELLLGWWLGWMGELVRYRLGGATGDGVEPGVARLQQALPARLETKHLFKVADKIRHYRGLLVSRANPNQQLLIEDLLIEWSSLRGPGRD